MADKIIKVKIGIDNIDKLKLGTPTGGKNTLTIGDGGTIDFLEVANQELPLAAKWANLFPKNGVAVAADETLVQQIEITASEDDIETLYEAILLRDALKDQADTTFEEDEIKFILNYLKVDDSAANADIDDTTKVWKMTEASFDNYNTNKLKIIDISAKIIHTGDTGKPETNFSPQLKELIDLKKTLVELAEKYSKARDFVNGPDFDLPTATEIDNITGKHAKAGGPVIPGSGLRAYQYGTFGGVSIANIAGNNKHFIYEGVKDAANATLLKDEIDGWIDYLEEIKTWKSYGLAKKSDIVKAKKNDFDVAVDDNEIKKYGDKALYKGFPIADPKQTVTGGANATDPFVIGNTGYTKTNIDNFRDKGKLKVFSEKIGGSGGDKDNYKFSDPRDLYGFQPGDINATGSAIGGHTPEDTATGSGVGSATDPTFYTKRQCEIMAATTVDKIIELAFLTTKFDEVKNTTKVIQDDGSGGGKEWILSSKEELLEFYLGKKCKGGNLGVFYHEGTSPKLFLAADFDAGTPDATKPGGKVKIAYNLIKELLPLLTKNYSGKTKEDKTELEADQTKLQELQTEAGKTPLTDKGQIGETWKDEITANLAKITSILTGKKIPDNDKEATKTEIQTGLFDATTPDAIGEKIIASALKAKITKGELPTLKTLVAALIKANKSDFKADKATKDTIKSYKEATAATDAAKKKLWDIVNDATVKEKDADQQTWAAKGWAAAEKFKDEENKLEKAKKALETALGGASDAKWTTVSEALKGETDDKVWTKAKEIYEAAKKIIEAKDSSDGEALANMKEGNEKAWNAINLIKTTDNKNYLDEAVDKAKKTKQDVVKFNAEINKFLEDGDADKLNELITKIEADPNFASADARYKNRVRVVKERGPIAIKVKKLNTDEAKKLAKILVEDIVGYSDKNNKTHLERLNEIEKELKEFQSAKSGNKHAAYTADSKVAGIVTALLSEVKTQKALLEKKEKKDSNTNGNEDKPFFKTWGGYVTIAVIILAVVGVIAYFIKTNSSEEGEGESE